MMGSPGISRSRFGLPQSDGIVAPFSRKLRAPGASDKPRRARCGTLRRDPQLRHENR
jgi:hypothetical protein